MRRAGAVVAAFALFGCSNVLGYDDVHFNTNDGGVYGTGAAAGKGGSGGSSKGGSGGTAANGGAAGSANGGSGNVPAGGAAGTSPVGGAGGVPPGGGGAPAGGTGGVAPGGGGTGGGGTTVCDRWKNDRADMSEGTWSGSTSGCNAGDISAAGRQNALKILNLYRFIAGLPEVSEEPSWDAAQQECALMMDANNQLSHTPPSSWTCYTAAGAGAAGQSNISTTPGVSAIDLYMADPGNPTTIGHRRWILSNSLGPIATGSTNGYSCLRVIGGSGNAGKPWMAFPPAGQVPIEMMNASFSSVDSSGWTVQSDSIDLGGAQVSVTDGGTNLPVTVTQLAGGYGSQYAIRFNPQGWSTQAGHTYSVAVSGVNPAINYDVSVVNCP